MISPLAITLAVAFWAPYNHGQPVCPDGVKIHNVYYGHTTAYVGRYTDTGALVPQCEMYADPSISRYPIAAQCAWAARNIGWSFFGLSNSTDSRNVMYSRRWVTPGACRPPKSRRQG